MLAYNRFMTVPYERVFGRPDFACPPWTPHMRHRTVDDASRGGYSKETYAQRLWSRVGRFRRVGIYWQMYRAKQVRAARK